MRQRPPASRPGAATASSATTRRVRDGGRAPDAVAEARALAAGRGTRLPPRGRLHGTLAAWPSAPSFSVGRLRTVRPVLLGGWEATSTSDSGRAMGEVFVVETQL